jgi:hypothetical protein
MTLVFISGPYRAPTIRGVVANIREAEAVALEYWREGYAVICPHLNTALMDGALPDSVWLEGDREILRRCDVVVMMPRWTESAGATAEHALAVELGLAVLYHE